MGGGAIDKEDKDIRLDIINKRTQNNLKTFFCKLKIKLI